FAPGLYVYNTNDLMIGGFGFVALSNDKGETWPLVFNNFVTNSATGATESSPVTALTATPINAAYWFVGFADGRLFFTFNRGAAWRQITPDGANPPSWGTNPISGIAVDPLTFNLYVTVNVFGAPPNSVSQIWFVKNATNIPPYTMDNPPPSFVDITGA